MPYPAGYRHDLSLITGPELPPILSPSGVGIIRGWADYENALDGQPVFMTRFDVCINRVREEQGRIATESTKVALVQGAEYWWLSRAISASLLWRTKEDYRPVSGFSGSVLCLGRPGDAEVDAVVFQNYQTPMRRSQISGEEDLTGDHGWSMKAGFFLPQEIRECRIVTGIGQAERNFHSVPFRNLSKNGGRRIFTDQR